MMYEPTKREKLLCRELMSRGLEKEFEAGLKESEGIMLEWKNNSLSGRSAFHKLRDHLNNFRKHLADRYDGLRGSDYLRVVAAIYDDGYLSDDDIKDFSDQAKDEILRWQAFWKKKY